MLKIEKRSILIDLVFIFILSLTPLLWFRPGEIMVGHDNVFPLNPLEFLQGRLYTWSNQGLGADQSLIMGTLPTHLIDALPYFLGFSLQTTQKIVFIFWFFSIGVSVYILASVINPRSRVFKLIASILYQFNFFILQAWFIAERTKFAAYIALPLVLAVFFSVYRKKLGVLPAAIFNSLILFIFSAGGLLGAHLFGGFFVSLTVFFLFFIVLALFQKNYLIIKNLFLAALLSILFVTLINAYSLLPPAINFISRYKAEVSASGGLMGFVEWAQEISVGSSFINLFRLQGIAEWYDNPDHPYAGYFLNNRYFLVLSFLWPLLIFSCLFLKHPHQKKKRFLYFFLVYLIGLFFTAGTHQPLGFIYSFLLQKIPGFAIFRSPYFKFAPAVFLSNAFLIAFFIDYFKGITRKVFFVFILTGWLIYHFPYFQGDFFAWQKDFSTRLKIPTYVLETGQWLSQSNKEEGRILLLPPFSLAWQFDVYNWKYLSLFPILRLATTAPILVNDANLDDNQRYLVSLVYKSLLEKDEVLFQKTVTTLNIEYLLLRNDVLWNLDWIVSDSPDLYAESLTTFSSIKRLRSFGEWDLYEVEKSSSVFTSVDQLADLQMPVGDLENYWDFDSADFFVREGNSSLIKNQLSSFIKKTYQKVECLDCRHEVPPIFNFPERVLFLPNSPWYPLVEAKRKSQFGEAPAKVALYDYLGLSLKYLAEVKKFIQERKTGQDLRPEYLNSYHETLKKISKLFTQLTDFETRYEGAYNVEFYLSNEENHLRVLLGEQAGNEDESKILETTFKLIKSTREEIKPYLLDPENRREKLYLLKIGQPGNYQILIKKEGLGAALISGEEIKITVEGQQERVIKIDNFFEESAWLNVGEFSFDEGEKQMVIILPETENLLSDFVPDELKLRSQTDQCFVANLKNYDNRKAYRMEINYLGGMANDFALYFTRLRDGEIFRTITKVGKEFWEESKKEIIDPDGKAQKQGVGFCGPQLSLDFLREKLTVRADEIIHPLVILLKEQSGGKQVKPEISWQKIRPTKYKVEIKRASQPFILSFLQSFDPRWQVLVDGQPVKNHFIIDAYANAWKIEKTGDYQIEVEYQPQKFFYLGLLISSVTFLGAGIYLILSKPWENQKN